MYENLKQRQDGSYVFDKKGMPYHCPNNDMWKEEYKLVDTWAKANPNQVTQEVPYAPSQEELNAQRVSEIDAELVSLDQSQLVNSLRIKASELEGKDDMEGRTRFLAAEAKKEVLRAERAVLTTI